MKNVLMAAAGAAALLMSGPAAAGVIFQSIPDLTIAPNVGIICSQCTGTATTGPDGQDVGELFVLASAATANSATFAVANTRFWPTDVTVSIFQATSAGTTQFTIGTNLFSNTYSSFASDINTGNGTDLVTVQLGTGVALDAGQQYMIFFDNPANLGLPQFGPPGPIFPNSHEVVHTPVFSGDGAVPPVGGVAIGGGGTIDIGVSLSTTAVPEPASWALMILGFGGVGAALRSRKKALHVV